MTQTQLIIMIIGLAGSSIFGIISFLIKSKIRSMDEDIKELQHSMNEFRDNDRERFERISQNMNEHRIETMKAIEGVNINIEKLRTAIDLLMVQSELKRNIK